MFIKLKRLIYNRTISTLIISFIIGALASISALIFRGLVASLHNLLFSGHLGFVYNNSFHTAPSIWGLGVILIPAIGGLIVIGIIENFAYDERGLSVPEIMYKTRHQNQKIHPRVALAKTLAAAISIGSGASVGQEGPVVQISAALSSFIGEIITLTAEQRTLLIAAGAAAGTAAIFNAPLAGIAFAIELLLTSINVLTIISITTAAIVAAGINYFLVGNASLFVMPTMHYMDNYRTLLIHLFLFVFFGIVLGVISALFIRSVYWFEDMFSFLFKNRYLRHIIGMLLLGIMLYAFMQLSGHYYIEGIGYTTIQDCLNSLITNPWLLLFLFSGKLLATCLSLGTGASGGIFSPALFLGAILGTLFGLASHYYFPAFPINPALFIIIGMAGIVGSTTGAVVTAILLVLEMTGDYHAAFPLIITTVIAYVVRKKICRESVYTLKLFRRGIIFH